MIQFSTAPLAGFEDMITFELVDGLPPGATYQFTSNPIDAGSGSSIIVDLSNVQVDGNFVVNLIGYAEGIDTLARSFELELLRNDFSQLSLLTPTNGDNGVPSNAVFSWTNISDASDFEIEIAKSPAFGSSIIDAGFVVNANEYISNVSFEENTLYYWRIRPVNVCGPGPYSIPFTFHTETLNCIQNSNDADVFISFSGTPTIESNIPIGTGNDIADVNIPEVRGLHEWISQTTASLISPEGTEVVLWSNRCFNLSDFRLGFDDDASQPLPCPMTSGQMHIPQEPLNTFIGQNATGIWKLKIEDNTNGAGGALEYWALEICAFINAENPVILNNQTLELDHGMNKVIDASHLSVTDNLSSPEQIKFTVVTLPAFGQLNNNGSQLSIGDMFTQQDIDNNRISYTHDDSMNGDDGFLFTVEDDEGGWIPTTWFDIDVEVITSVEDDFLSEKITLLPNPAKDEVRISMSEPMSDVTVQIFSIHGQLLRVINVEGHSNGLTLQVGELANGVYVVRIQSGKMSTSKKLTIHNP